jgi:hypothetical protein
VEVKHLSSQGNTKINRGFNSSGERIYGKLKLASF